MSDRPPPDEPVEGEAQLPAQAPAGSLLRLRDVQALNRSFRRLAEVQEALLDRLDELEQESRSPMQRALPWMAGGTLGLVGIALVLLLGPQPGGVSRKPPEITVEVPPDPALAEAVAKMGEDVTRLLDERAAFERSNADLTRRLLEAEEQRLDLLSKIGSGEVQIATASGGGEAVGLTPEGESARLATPDGEDEPDLGNGVDAEEQAWVGVSNMLLRSDGFRNVRLQRATRIPGEPALSDVVWMDWGGDGVVDGAIHAARVDLKLRRMTGMLVLEFRDGWRAQGGVRSELPEEGLTVEFDDVNVDAWLEHLPELKEDAEGGAPDSEVETVRLALDALLSEKGTYRYYRMGALGEIVGQELRMVQINWFRNDGALVKTLEADAMEIVLHDSGTVELLLKDGAFLEGREKHPFSGDRFRLHLPRQDLEKWRAAGIPYREAEA